jgi:hypothetical protein
MSRPTKQRTWPALHPDVASGVALATLDEAAVALRVSPSMVWKLKAAGVVQPVNLGGPVRFHLPSVLAQVRKGAA